MATRATTPRAKTDERGYGTTAEIAVYLKVHPGTLRNWRGRGEGPPCHGQEKGTRYSYAEVDEWMRARNKKT